MQSYELHRGAFKRITLRVRPPLGDLRVSAPWYLPRFIVDRFVEEKQGWIELQRSKIDAPAVPEPSDRVWVWGDPWSLVVESPGRLPRLIVRSEARQLTLRVPEGWGPEKRQKVLDQWEAERVQEELNKMLPLWCSKTGLTVERWTVKRLRSRWGSCRPDARSLVFNARLGAYPKDCLEHVVVHELMHLLEPAHNARFHSLVESWLPGAHRVKRWLRAGPAGPDGAVVSQGDPSRPEEERLR